MSDALGFELPGGLAEPTPAPSPLPFDDAGEPAAAPMPKTGADETVH
jgi:hypothetical protein